MNYNRVLETFVQGEAEPFYMAWGYFKELLHHHPHHDFDEYRLLNIFFNGLTRECRLWLEGESGSYSLMYDLAPDELVQVLEETAAADFYDWNPPVVDTDSGEFQYMADEWRDTESSPPSANAEFGGSLPPIEVIIDNFQSQLDNLKATLETIEIPQGNSISDFMARDELHQMQLNIDDFQAKLHLMTRLNEESTVREPTQASGGEDEEVGTREGNSRGLEDEKSVGEEEESYFTDEDAQSEASSFAIYIVEPAPFIKESLIHDFFWSAPPPPSFAPYFDATRAVGPERGLVARTSESRCYIAKLEGVKNQDPWIVSFDAFHGRKPLFDEVRRLRQ